MIVFLLYILLVLLVSFIVSGYYFSEKVIYKPIRTTDRIVEHESANPCFDPDWYEMLEKKEVFVPSPFGYKISGEFTENHQSKGKTMIFCHGISVTRICAIKYAKMFYDGGWNLFLYDHRRHGKSGGKTTTYRYFEKHDLKAVFDFVREKVGSTAIIGIHGESMGAAIMLQYAGMEDKADFYIADCPYSNLSNLLVHRLRLDFHLPVFPLMYMTDFFIHMRGKFRLKDVTPVLDVENIQHPVLFIHGACDDYVPTEMSREMYHVKKGMKQIYLVPEAGHAQALQADPGAYWETVFHFLQRAGIAE